MKKRIWLALTLLPLLAMALLTLAPLLFLAGGSVMGGNELKDHIRPAIDGTGGYVSWPLFPLYPLALLNI